MLTRREVNALLTAGVTLGLPGLANAAGEVVVPVATWGSPTHINIVEFLRPLETALREKAGDRIVVKHFPSGQIANDADMPQVIPFGAVKVGWVTMARWSGLVPDVKIGDAPTGLTMAQFAEALDGGITAALDARFREKGATILAVTDLGPVVIVSNKPVKVPADLKGVKIRVFSEGTADLFRVLGAAPVQLAFGDVYAALQRGVIDAALIGFQGVKSQRMYEIAEHLLIPASFCGTGLQAYVANLAWWEGLAEADRTAIAEAMKTAETECRRAIAEDRGSLADEYRGNGMTVVSLQDGTPEMVAWRQATAGVMAAAEASLSPDVVEPIRRIRQS